MSLPPTWYLYGKDHLPHRLLLLTRMIDRETARQLQRDFGLSVAEWRVIAYVSTAGPSSAADIGAAFEADRAEVSRAVTKLIDAGLITRTPEPDNRKKQIISVTPKGEALFLDARGRRQQYFYAILQDLGTKDQKKFDHILNAIALRVDTLRNAKD